ncbi:uncharacterized protein LOC100875042 isoform X2 [Megachile rotundata]|uniref:uncharacterized protein LOC100875042 isoform X2 n=1 Tax=Megachile rotundata TaxID=143995 RepID=UPI00061510A4|nr:PREDICTED: IQ domain-containing protein D-like [Megachile rotundata]
MDELLSILAKKYLDVGVERIITESLDSKENILVEKIKLLCLIVKNNPKRCLEGIFRATELSDFTRNISQLMLKVKQWTLTLQKERSDFSRFQRDVKIAWRTMNLTQTNIEESFREKMTIRTLEYASKVLTKSLEHDVQKELMQVMAKSLESRSKYIGDIRYSKRNSIYDSCYEAKKECFDQLEKYSDDIERLHGCKSTLLTERDFIEKQRFVVQDQLITQRATYNQLKEERELNAKEAFSMKFQYFRQNRAARIIQRNWRFYCVRVSWKRRKGKK